MYDPSLRTKSYITFGVICAGLAFMIPIVFKPFFLRMLGHDPEPPPYVNNDDRYRTNREKLFGNKNETAPSQKEKYLKDYYRNFRYNVEKEKFMMDSDSSDEDNFLLRDSLGGTSRKSHSRGRNPRSAFDWSRAYGENEGDLGMSPDIYRSAKSLPRDLEYLLKKVDDNNLDDAEVHRLRVRLEEVEQEMTRLLEVVNSAALPRTSAMMTPACNHHHNHPAHLREGQMRGSLECSEKTDDEEALLSASEGEGENNEVSCGAGVFSPRGFSL
ncbi:unnamed protein product [Dibothriocephalus latus]|uniref:Resistance to inhibitors of cholinesterase protein 3 N-terminal domain-containing protein n=1 Tax=Dibothriocephalus latus TaxID=60516 RepID=A0A3P7L6P5_DIBLA|nr:unnamed protein product [Dibothriocephalus latus]